METRSGKYQTARHFTAILRKPMQRSGRRHTAIYLGLVVFGLCVAPISSCRLLPRSDAQPSPDTPGQEADQPVAVQTAVAATGTVKEILTYTGTTRPVRQVSLRSQVSGQLQQVTVDAGDGVAQGAVLAQVDDALLRVAVNEAQAELTSRQSEVAQAAAEVSNVKTSLEAAKVRFQQAQTEADRLQRLAAAGAVSTQEAEQAQLAVDVARQALKSSEEQIRTRQQAVTAAQGRVASQQAVVDQAREQLSYAAVRAPLSGVVLQRLLEAGDYVQAGGEILQIGDLSTLEVTVQVSELDLNRISQGQTVRVTLDAFPDRSLTGRINRIAPVADTSSRLLPVEITIPNPDGRVGSGLLARVQFTPPGQANVVLPESALAIANPPQSTDPQPTDTPSTVFVVDPKADPAIAQARQVQIGTKANGQVEILSGLQPGESYVLKSDRPLADGQPVRLSILSETSDN